MDIPNVNVETVQVPEKTPQLVNGDEVSEVSPIPRGGKPARYPAETSA